MKNSIRTIFVILAIVMSFVSVQAAQAVEVEGTVTAIEHNTITLDGTVTVSSLGPRSYWRSKGISYPKVGDYVIVEAYDGASGYIAVSVTVCDLDDCDCDEENAECIDLRDPDTLIPLWIRFQVTETTDLAATAAGSAGNCCPGCPGCENCQPKSHLWGGPPPHGD
jgi:hypothetical protein